MFSIKCLVRGHVWKEDDKPGRVCTRCGTCQWHDRKSGNWFTVSRKALNVKRKQRAKAGTVS